MTERTQYRRWFERTVTGFVTRLFFFYGQIFIQFLRNVSCLVTRNIHENHKLNYNRTLFTFEVIRLFIYYLNTNLLQNSKHFTSF